MSEENLLSIFPKRKIKAYDGMPVTAASWEQAHTFHNISQQAHNLFFHGSGVLIGLDVIASDPADNIVFILPGVAVDPKGRVIVLSEPVAYDLGDEIDGQLYLTISYRESNVGGSNRRNQSETRYTSSEFLITARPTQSDHEAVELARFVRENRSAPIKDAKTTQKPDVNEIDQRFRKIIETSQMPFLTAAVIYLGKVKEKVHGQGLMNLASEARQLNRYNLVVDDDLKFEPSVLGNHLIYFAAEGKFKLNASQVKGLKGYLERGGFLFLEACDEEAESIFLGLSKELGLKLKEVGRNDALLNKHYLFAAVPQGYQEGKVLVERGALLSTVQLGRLWNAEQSDHTPSREELRAGLEFGINLLGEAAQH